MTQVALASGFASVRRFNAAFVAHYGLNPSALRRAGDARPGARRRLGRRAAGLSAALRRRGHAGLLRAPRAAAAWRRRRRGGTRQLARTLRVAQGGRAHAGWLQLRFDARARAGAAAVGDSLAAVLPTVISRVRAMLDLDADPMAINARAACAASRTATACACRARSTASSSRCAPCWASRSPWPRRARWARGWCRRFGEPIATPVAGLDRLFPTPAALAAASGDALGQLGIVRQRQAALHRAGASEVLEGRLALHAGADVPATLAALQALPGIGDWTAQYIAMRALRWPDAFPAGDVALQKALGVTHARAPRRRPRRPGGRGAATRCCAPGTALPAAGRPRRRRPATYPRASQPDRHHEIQERHSSTATHDRQPARRRHARGHRRRPGRRLVRAASATGPTRSGWHDDPAHPVLREAAAQLADYFAGRRAALRPAAGPVARHGLPAVRVAGAAGHSARAAPPATAPQRRHRQAGRGARGGRGRRAATRSA